MVGVVALAAVGVFGKLLLPAPLIPLVAKLALRLEIDGRGGSGPGLLAVGVAGDEGEENCEGEDMVWTRGGKPPATEEPEGEAGTVALVMVVVATESCEEE